MTMSLLFLHVFVISLGTLKSGSEITEAEIEHGMVMYELTATFLQLPHSHPITYP